MGEYDIEQQCRLLAKSGTEHGEQRALFAWLNYAANIGQYPHAKLAYAIPNGGKRDKVTAARLKAEGVKPGVPDVHYPVSAWAGSLVYLTLYMELKARDGHLAEKQDDFHVLLRQQGHAVLVCYGWRAARDAFVAYHSCKKLDQWVFPYVPDQ